MKWRIFEGASVSRASCTSPAVWRSRSRPCHPAPAALDITGRSNTIASRRPPRIVWILRMESFDVTAHQGCACNGSRSRSSESAKPSTDELGPDALSHIGQSEIESGKPDLRPGFSSVNNRPCRRPEALFPSSPGALTRAPQLSGAARQSRRRSSTLSAPPWSGR